MSFQPFCIGLAPCLRACSICLLAARERRRAAPPAVAGSASAYGDSGSKQAERLETAADRRGRARPAGTPASTRAAARRSAGPRRTDGSGIGQAPFPGAGRRERELAWSSCDRGHVRLAVHRPASDDRRDRGREADHASPLAHVPVPAGRDEQERSRLGAGRAVADVGEVVRPRVDELEHVVAPGRVRHVQPHRAAADVDVRDRVHGVVVDRDERLLRPGQLGGVAERVERAGRQAAHPHVNKPVDLVQVEYQREAVHERLRRQYRAIVCPSHRSTFGRPTPTAASSAASCSAVSCQSPAAAFSRTCSGLVAPAITDATPGREASPAIASSSSE